MAYDPVTVQLMYLLLPKYAVPPEPVLTDGSPAMQIRGIMFMLVTHYLINLSLNFLETNILSLCNLKRVLFFLFLMK